MGHVIFDLVQKKALIHTVCVCLFVLRVTLHDEYDIRPVMSDKRDSNISTTLTHLCFAALRLSSVSALISFFFDVHFQDFSLR